MRIIDAETMRAGMSWRDVVWGIRQGHKAGRPQLRDVLLADGDRKILVRTSWTGGGGLGLKAVTIFPDNPSREPPMPAVQGQFMLFDEDTGQVSAIVDGSQLTYWKTAGDSALGADQLARPDVTTMAMIGAGAMAEPLIRAHLSVRPSIAQVVIWNRSAERAEALAARLDDLRQVVTITGDLEGAVRNADLVSVATMTVEPIIRGAWLADGAHLDLVGAYRPDMREADDDVFRRGSLFVDCRDTTIGEIGELISPMERGIITERDVLGDHWDMIEGKAGRRSAGEITVFKNGGGAHLDLMVAKIAAAL